MSTDPRHSQAGATTSQATTDVSIPRTPNSGDRSPHASGPVDEESLRNWEGLPDDAVILAAPFAVTPPMRMPDGVWAMLVVAIGTTHEDGTGEVELFAGCWQHQQQPADRVDGDLMLRLGPSRQPAADPADEPALRVDIELLLAYKGSWQRVGLWSDMDGEWPQTIGPTARAVMRLHTDLTETVGSGVPVVSLHSQPPPGHVGVARS